jgi:hypothetical protein
MLKASVNDDPFCVGVATNEYNALGKAYGKEIDVPEGLEPSAGILPTEPHSCTAPVLNVKYPFAEL